MRKLSALLVSALLLPALAGRTAALTVAWTGAGVSPAASDGANWTAGRPPAEGDSVLFGILSSRDCDWDLDVSVADFTVNEAFKGDIRFEATLNVSGRMTVKGGMVDLKDSRVSVGSRLHIGGNGMFEMSGGTLEVGSPGIVVDESGAFFSRGGSEARIKAARPGEYFPFIVAGGHLVVSNQAGTVVEGSRGMAIHSKAEVERVDFIKFRGIKPGASALRVYGAIPRPQGWEFDDSVRRTIEPMSPAREKEDIAALAREMSYPDEPADGGAGLYAPSAKEETPQDAPFSAMAEYDAARARANVVPYLSLQFNGGQYFFEGEKGGLSGNVNLLASAAVKHERLGGWTLVPVLSSQYQGTKQVTDLVGGGTLFQERMSHNVSLRGVYELRPGLKIKPSLGYKWELLKETRDESWGDGLFDYRRPGFSFEAEYAYAAPFTVKAGYDFYYIDFVNYYSLESIIKDSQGNELARELAGRDVLDSYNHGFSFGGSMEGPWRTYLEGGLTSTLRFFPEQHVVKDSGDLDSTTRRDLSSQFAAAWRAPREIAPRWKAVAGARLSFGYNYSNQNSYDAQRLKFLKNYYDSLSLRAGVDLNVYHKLREGRPLELNLSVTAGRTNYIGRQAQDPSGLYVGDKVGQNETVLNMGLSYPVAPHFVWTAQFGYGRQTSNQHFERLYRYNLKTTTYRFGFGYEF